MTAAVLLGLGVLLTGAQAPQVEAAAVQLPVVEVVYENMDESTINEVKYLLPELKKHVIPIMLKEVTGDRKTAIKYMKGLICSSFFFYFNLFRKLSPISGFSNSKFSAILSANSS